DVMQLGWKRRLKLGLSLCLLCGPWMLLGVMRAEEKTSQEPAKETPPATTKPDPARKNLNFRQDGLIPMNKQETVLVDKAGKRVLLKTRVVLQQGALEMFCCLKQTKEHESILAIDALAQDVHAALLVIGAKPGHPVVYDPEFRPPAGEKIDLFVSWTDPQGNQKRQKAQTWVRRSTSRVVFTPLEALPKGLELTADTDMKYDLKRKELYWYGIMTPGQKDHWLNENQNPAWHAAVQKLFQQSQVQEMNAEWVFSGSQFYVDEFNGRQRYMAEGGDLICVANFGSATLDITTSSSSDNEQLVYEAFTERIPPRNTEVTLELIPRFAAKDKPDGKPAPATPPPPAK
ncbi:MAG: YdjY domain-containing protein, partial [Planctomycetales bacterium]